MAGPLPVLFGATTGTAPYAPILKRAWFGFNPPFRQSTSSRVSSTNHSCPSRFWSALHTWIKLELWIMICKLVGAPIIYFPRWQGGPASIFLGRMYRMYRTSDWSEKYVKGRGGGEGWTHQAHPHIHKTPLQIFPCLTKVNIWCRRRGSNLYHTGRAEFELYKKVWVLDKPRFALIPRSWHRLPKFSE